MVKTNLKLPARKRWSASKPRLLQIATLLVLGLTWEALSASGLLFRGVVPSILTVTHSLFDLLVDSAFWSNLSITSFVILVALSVGSSAGILVGMALGGSSFLS